CTPIAPVVVPNGTRFGARSNSTLAAPFFFFFNDTATTEIYTLSLHDALPICPARYSRRATTRSTCSIRTGRSDRKSTRLNSSHTVFSYHAFCLKKKKTET